MIDAVSKHESFNIWRVGSKTPIDIPKLGFLGDFTFLTLTVTLNFLPEQAVVMTHALAKNSSSNVSRFKR